MFVSIIYGWLITYLILPFALLSIIILLPKYIKYRNSDYKEASKNGFFKTVFDKGNYGEFITFTYLENLDFYKRLMTNLYLPKSDGKTTEVDLIMISHTGIYVFESKNYSGWIYGDENHKNWTQTLNGNTKNKFFNPIWQNKGHINALMTVLGIQDTSMFKSIIVFSERCKLKKINVTNPDIRVIKRNMLIKEIKEEQENSQRVFKIDDIESIYLQLQEFSCVDDITKEDHIRNIKEG